MFAERIKRSSLSSIRYSCHTAGLTIASEILSNTYQSVSVGLRQSLHCPTWALIVKAVVQQRVNLQERLKSHLGVLELRFTEDFF